MQLPRFLALTASLGLASASCGHGKNNTTSAYSTSSSQQSTISSQITASSQSTSSSQSTASSVSTSSTQSTASSQSTISSVSTTNSDSTTGSISTTGSVTTTSSQSTTSPQPTQICQVHGSRLSTTVAISTSDKLVDNTFDGCSALCGTTSGCQSFSIQIETGGACSLYGSALYTDFTLGSGGPTIFWDADCPKPVISGPSISSYTASTTYSSVPTAPGSVVTFSAYVTPTILSSDSPPYTPTGAQEKPTDDNEFIATYTYTEFQLTVSATGSPPVTTGVPRPTGTDLPDLPCMVSPGPQTPFSVLNENFLPMVSRTNSIGPLLQPTEAPAADDPILNPETLTLPSFYLQEAAGVSGVYDMVYDGETTQYVAMTLDGQVVLVDASTGPSFVGLGVTSIFSVDCLGLISITYGGSKYTWSTDGQSCSIVPASDPPNNMKALPVTMPEVNEMLKDRKRTQELAETLIMRHKLKERVNADTNAPQCPNTPTGLVSKTKSGYELGQGNFCDNLDNLSEYWALSPFDFDGSCLIQSLCYDQCEDFSWAGCNAIFGYLMLLSCAANFESWWEVVQAVACAAQAAYFTSVAATQTGRDLYYKAQDSMCFCFCSNPPDTCVFTDGSFYCADISGTDNNNCGNCGRQCGANSACHAGVCGCPRDQCGDTCLDLRNNPNHCGSCGNVCDPHYCIGGQCYAPSPDECAPDQSVTNYMFDTYSPTWANWTMAAYPDSALGTDIVFGASRYTPQTGSTVYALSITMNDLPAGGRHAGVTQKNVKMCPGFNYEFTFNMGYVNQVNSGAVVSNADCTVRWLTGMPDTWDGNSGFQTSPSYSIGASNPTYETFGPWALTVKEGDTGVTKVKASLYVDLTAVVSCNTPVGGTGHFIITDVEMNPTTQTTKRSPTIGEQAAAFALEQRDGNATEISETLAPYYPAQQGGAELFESYTTGPIAKGRRNWAAGVV
ncbi:hypothetical protein BJ170DRAFT_174149 [Xylariales sp. AK1849]|nr:hypothetical protein BJ170DRAFT_174149 [Xylariales sp. AK1849]